MNDTPRDDVAVEHAPDDGAKSGPSQPAEEVLDPVARAEQHSAFGARCHALKKYAEAADAHSKACEVLAAHFGDLAPEVAAPLLAYGKSLLEYARSRSAVLGLQAGAKDGPAPDTAQSSDQQPEAGPSTRAAKDPQTAAREARIHFSGDSSDDEDQGEDEAGDGEEAKADTFNLEDELENAHQALDTARVIFSRTAQASVVPDERRRQLQKSHAQALDLLGDVHTESEQFEQAVESYKDALAIKEALADDSRVLAEAHLLIALAYEFVPNNGLAMAIEHAIKARDMMVANLASLTARRDAGEASARDLEEIADIEGLMGELDAKVDELKTVPQESAEAQQQSAQDKALEDYLQSLPHLRQGMGAGPSGLGDSAVVNDLNLLVKKKKPAPTDPVESSAPKRKADDASLNGNSNGVEDAKKPKVE